MAMPLSYGSGHVRSAQHAKYTHPRLGARRLCSSRAVCMPMLATVNHKTETISTGCRQIMQYVAITDQPLVIRKIVDNAVPQPPLMSHHQCHVRALKSHHQYHFRALKSYQQCCVRVLKSHHQCHVRVLKSHHQCHVRILKSHQQCHVRVLKSHHQCQKIFSTTFILKRKYQCCDRVLKSCHRLSQSVTGFSS